VPPHGPDLRGRDGGRHLDPGAVRHIGRQLETLVRFGPHSRTSALHAATCTVPAEQSAVPHEQLPASAPSQLQQVPPLHSFGPENAALHAQLELEPWQPIRTQEQDVAPWQHRAGPSRSVASHTSTGFFGGLSPPSAHSQELGAAAASHSRFELEDDEDDDEQPNVSATRMASPAFCAMLESGSTMNGSWLPGQN
jgi:hypothetical protein